MTGILDVPAPLQDCDGLIDPSAFPIPTTDHIELRNQASALRKAGKGVAETGEDIVSTWGGLSACYTAPESEDLLGALAPVSANGSDVESGTDRAAGALEDFADEVREIKMEWNDLRNRAAAFRERMLSEEDWKKSDHWFTSTSSNVEKSNAYRDEALALIKWYERAQRICANTISRGIVGRTVFVRGSSSQATTNPDAFVFDTIDTDADIPSVWGEPGTADQYWHQDALDAVWDFGVDAVQGTGAMLGMHSSEGWFEMSWGDALKEYHWDNLTSAASLIGMYDAETDSLGWSGTDTIHGAWRDLAHSVVPWEEWGDRPGYVIGTAALNVVGLVGGAALTATGVGAVVGVPLMAWRGMSIVDGMGGSGSRGGSGDGVETNISSPSMNLPNFGGNGSPVANLNFDSSDLSGFDPRQVSEIGASLERLYNSQQSSGTGSGETAGGGRPFPSRPIGQDRSETSGPERRPAEDPRVDDMLTFEDIVNHPDNATLGDRLRTENQRALDQVDRDNKTRSNDTPASDEGTWTAREIIDGPEGDRSRVLTPAGGGHNDTFDASAANKPPSSPLHARADGIDGPGSGRGPGNEASGNNRGGDHGANMSDRSPTAHNQDGTGPTRNNLDDGASSNGNGRDVPGQAIRDTSTARSDSDQGPTSRRDDSTTERNGRGEDRTDTSPSPQPTPVSDGPHGSRGERDANEQGPATERDRTSADNDKPISVPADRFDAQTKAWDLLEKMDLGTGKTFDKNFVDLVNSKKYGPLIEAAFYKSDGTRFRASYQVGGQSIPTLTRADKNDPWVSRDSLPKPDPPKYLIGKIEGTRSGITQVILQKLDKFADLRQISLTAYNPLDRIVQSIKKNNNGAKVSPFKEMIAGVREARRPMGAMKTRLTEQFGEGAAERAVRDNFTGKKHTFEEVRKDRHGRDVLDEDGKPIVDSETRILPKVKEGTPENPNPIPPSENAPKNGNDQFDQIWRGEDGEFIIVEAKSSQSTELGERTVRVDGELKRVSQGSREYFDDILEAMIERGGEEKKLAREIKQMLAQKPEKIHYVEARGKPGDSGDYQGNSMKFFDISED
ncbi:hypothetical protein [Nocardiopsis alba]|uniref:hypothetical protein n=1 Tax=Nocardiopsis alba TaxID=53437 RepID=UPI0036CF1576